MGTWTKLMGRPDGEAGTTDCLAPEEGYRPGPCHCENCTLIADVLRAAAATLAAEAENYRDGPGSKGLQPHGHDLHGLASRCRRALAKIEGRP